MKTNSIIESYMKGDFIMKIDNTKLKGAMGVFGKIAIVVAAISAAVDVIATDRQAKTVEKLVKDVAELQSKNS